MKFTHESDNSFFGVSLLDSYTEFDGYDGRLGGSGDSNWAVELAGAYYLENGLSFFLGGYYEDAEGPSLEGETYAVNAYVTYETGAWIFAAEVNFGNSETGAYSTLTSGVDDDAVSGLLMANYAYSEQGSITGRISYETFDWDNPFEDELEQIKYTLAHNWAFTDNLSLVAEVSFADADFDATDAFDGDFEVLTGAIELLFAF